MPTQEYKNLLSPAQKAEYEQKIKQAERFLATHKNSPFKRVRELDEGFAQSEIRKYKKILAERTAPEVDGKERDRIARRAKYLEAKIKEGMPTRDEMMGKRHSDPDNPNRKYQEAIPSIVDRNTKWMLANAARIKEWKHLKRILDPTNPGACNVEQLRKIH